MDVNSHVALSGQLALSRRLETIANNVANAGTVGYKGSRAIFADVFANSLTGGGAALFCCLLV